MDVIAIILAGGFVAVMILFTLGAIPYMIIRAARGGGSKQSTGQAAAETRLIQEIHQGFVKMEGRVEALETLLLDDEHRKKAEFEKELGKGESR